MLRWLVLALLTVAGQPALTESQSAAEQAPSSLEPPPEGPWLTDRMIESVIRRWALEARAEYELTEEQVGQVEHLWLERWPRFMQENRAELQPLVNEYVEARLAVEPPTEEGVRDWAERAMPMFEQLCQEIEAGYDEVRPLMTPTQRGRFEAKVQETRAGLSLFRQRIDRWQRGEFEPTEWWDPPERRSSAATSRPADRSASAQGKPPAPPDQITLELSRWDRYVAEYAATHRFDQGQRRAAQSMLNELKSRALDHRDQHRAEVATLERKIREGRATDEEWIRNELVRLYGPIDDLFRELEARIRTIPTETQRRTASQPATSP